jgi:tRNA pseudouridine13 synthase
VQKQNLTTWDMVAVFARYLNIDANEIGYAGLKDKNATTIQYLSFNAKLTNNLKKFKHKQIKILEFYKSHKSIKMGDLKGNKFGINLYDVDNIKAGKIQKQASKIIKNGLVNYFGYQRFGRGDSITQAKEMLAGEIFIEDKKLRNFLVSVYQSDLFNRWLAKRVELSSDGKFKLLSGDVYVDEKGRFFTPKEIPLKDFLDKKLLPTGLLCGRDVFKAKAKAREIEKEFDDEFLPAKGYRREAIVFVKEFHSKFFAKEEKLHVEFSLPKGSYATVFLEAIKGKEILPNS